MPDPFVFSPYSWDVCAQRDRSDYLRAALDIVELQGFASLTLRSLGEKLGVDSTAVYRHFPNKESLYLAMFDYLADQFVLDLPEPSDPISAIRNQALVTRAFFTRFPDLSSAIGNAEEAPQVSTDSTATVINALRELGLSGDDVVVWYQLIEGFVMGTTIFDTSRHPHNWDIRAQRYQAIGFDEFVGLAASPIAVRDASEAAFRIGLEGILTALKKHARVTLAL